MKTDRILKLIQQKKTMRSGGALPLPQAQTGISQDATRVVKPLIQPLLPNQKLPPFITEQQRKSPTVFIKDTRKTHPVTGQPINPNRDLKTGNYNKAVFEAIIKEGKKLGLNKQQVLDNLLITGQESTWGTTDPELGHALHADYISGTVDGKQLFPSLSETEVQAYEEDPYAKHARAQLMNYYYNTNVLNKPSSNIEQRLQFYNTPYPEKGQVTKDTEKDYYKGTNKRFYGVDVTKKPLSMASYPYGKTVASFYPMIANNPEIQYLLYQHGYKKQGGLTKAQTGQQTGWTYDKTSNQYIPQFSLPEVQVTAERPGLFKQMRKKFMDSYNPLLPPTAQPGLFMEALGVPQQALMYGLTGQYARPSEIYPTKGIGNFGNKFNDFMFDVVTDPLAYLAEASQLRGALQGPKKVPASLADIAKDISSLKWEQMPLDDPRWGSYMDRTYGPDLFDKELKKEALSYLQLTKDPRYLERAKAIDAEARAAGYESNLETKLKRFWQQGELNAEDNIGKIEFPFNIKTADAIPYTDETGQTLDALGLSSINAEKWIEKMVKGEELTGKDFYPHYRNITINKPRHITENVPARGTVHHELKHHWTDALAEEPYYSQLLKESVVPNEVNTVLPRKNYSYYTHDTEIDAHLMTNMRDEMVKKGILKDHFDELTKEKLGKFLQTNPEYRGVQEYFKPGQEIVWDRNKFVTAFNKALPAIVPGAVGLKALQQSLQQPEQQKQDGGVLNMNTNKMLNYINASYQKGGGIKDMVVSEIWEKVTGTKWSQAKKLGLSDGSYETNIKLRQMLINEAMQPKPNFGKFIGQPSSKLPAPSAIVNQLRQEGLAQASMPRDATSRVKPIMSPIAPASPSKQQPAQKRTYPKVEVPGYHTAPPNTSATAKPQMQRVVGSTPVTSVKSVPLQKVQTPTQAVAMPSSTRVAAPTMSPVVGRAPVPLPQQAEKPQLALVNPNIGQPTYSQQDESRSVVPNLGTMGTLSMLNMLPVAAGVQYAPMFAGNAARSVADQSLQLLPSFASNYLRGNLLNLPPVLTEDQKKEVAYAIQQGEKKGYGVPEEWRKKGFTGSTGYDEYRGGRDPLNAIVGLTDPRYWGDGKAMNRLKRVFGANWDAANAMLSLGKVNFKKNPDGSYTIGDQYNFEEYPYQANPSNVLEYMENPNIQVAPAEMTIPAEYFTNQKKKGGSKQSLKIRIRKNG